MNKIHKKQICKYCGREIDVASIVRHETACGNPNSKLNQKKNASYYKIDHEDLFCKYCKKQCKNLNSLTQHEIRCPYNPDRRSYDNLTKYVNENIKGQTAETNEQIRKQSEKLRALYKEGKKQNTLQAYIKDINEYIYKEHNEQEINKWLSYIKDILVTIPDYSTSLYSEGYAVVKGKNEINGNTVNICFEHNFIANIYLEGNLKKENSVHHINRVRDDNRISNLMIFESSKEHKRFHASKYAFLIYNKETHLFNCTIKKP